MHHRRQQSSAAAKRMRRHRERRRADRRFAASQSSSKRPSRGAPLKRGFLKSVAQSIRRRISECALHFFDSALDTAASFRKSLGPSSLSQM